jgi:hypothetical protein
MTISYEVKRLKGPKHEIFVAKSLTQLSMNELINSLENIQLVYVWTWYSWLYNLT